MTAACKCEGMVGEVDEAPDEYEGMAWDQEGAEVIQETLDLLGKSVEIVRHNDTYYVILK